MIAANVYLEVWNKEIVGFNRRKTENVFEHSAFHKHSILLCMTAKESLLRIQNYLGPIPK